jgi:FeS assembly SUF system regulator
MLKMSKLTDYGTIVLAQLSVDEGRMSSAHKVAADTRLAKPTVSKLLKTLSHAGLVISQRGTQGGYALARPPEEISAAQIIDALEGPVAITECSSGKGLCDLEPVCRVGNAWQRINIKIRQALEEVSLTDLQYDARSSARPNLRAALTPHSKLS